jgi:hypothetical protein
MKMKQFCGIAFRDVFLASIFCVMAAAPAFAWMDISVGTIDRYADGADVPIVIYEDGSPGAGVFFSFELYDKDDIIRDGSGTTDGNGEALIEFSGLQSDARFEGEIWVGNYNDPEAVRTFSFATDSNLESKGGGCNVGLGGWTGLILSGFIWARRKK